MLNQRRVAAALINQHCNYFDLIHVGDNYDSQSRTLGILFDVESLTVIESKLVKSLSHCLSTASRVA